MKNTFHSSRYFMFNDAKNTSLQPRILLFIPCSKKKEKPPQISKTWSNPDPHQISISYTEKHGC